VQHFPVFAEVAPVAILIIGKLPSSVMLHAHRAPSRLASVPGSKKTNFSQARKLNEPLTYRAAPKGPINAPPSARADLRQTTAPRGSSIQELSALLPVARYGRTFTDVDGNSSIRVVVGEDEPIVRAGVIHVLEEAGFEVVGMAEDAEELLRITETEKPNVVVTDIQMPPTSTNDGLEAAKAIRSAWPSIGVVVLSQFLEAQYALELVSEGAEGIGYLLKDRVGDLGTFTEAVRRVANGGTALDPEVVRRMVDRPRLASPIEQLTNREREVLALMAEGLSNQGIADQLVVSVAAIERHVTSIFVKLDLRPTSEDHRRVLAVLQYLRR
jgi:DNA-binding NarL/FixJ family response regulator